MASAQSDQFSLCAQWVAKDPSFLHADNEDSDQIGWKPRLIWVFAWRTLALLVLSCHGSDAGAICINNLICRHLKLFYILTEENNYIMPLDFRILLVPSYRKMDKCKHVPKIRPAWDHSILNPEKWMCYVCRETESVWVSLEWAILAEK